MTDVETITVANVNEGNDSHPKLARRRKNQGKHRIDGDEAVMASDRESVFPWRNERFLQKRYAWAGLTVSELATRFGCSDQTIEKWLDRHGIQNPWEDEETLRYLRFERGLSQYVIARRLGCTQGTISRRFDEFGIDGNRIIPDRPWHDEETLRELYHDQNLSMREVASELGCERQSVEKWIHHHDIETRSPNPETPDQLKDEQKLRTLYHSKEMSTYAIADQLDCAPSTVHDWLKRHFIETRTVGSQPGELHHRWEGGAEPYYGENWYRKRRSALIRDQYRCQRCGITDPEHRNEQSFGLDIHHIEPLRSFDSPEEANRLDNLLTLCRKCHSRVDSIDSESLEGEDG